MILVHGNKLTEKFLDECLRNNKEYQYVRVSVSDQAPLQNIIDSVVAGTMYYERSFVEISMGYDYKKLRTLLALESDEITLVLVMLYYDDCKRALNVIRRQDIDCKFVSLKTIDKIKALTYIHDYFKNTIGKDLKNKLLYKIYQYLLYSNVNQELSALSNMKTIAMIESYVGDRQIIRPSSFAHSLLMGDLSKAMGRFLMDNKSSLNYVLTILENYVDEILDFFDLMYKYDIDQNNLGARLVQNPELQKKISFAKASKFMKLCSKNDYLFYLNLKQELDKAKTRFQKQKIILGLICNGK